MSITIDSREKNAYYVRDELMNTYKTEIGRKPVSDFLILVSIVSVASAASIKHWFAYSGDAMKKQTSRRQVMK